MKKVCFPECFFRYVSANTASHVQSKHRTTQEQLRASNIKTLLLDVMNELASNADVDCGLYKLEWLCSVVLRLTQSFSRDLAQCKNKVNLTASWKLIGLLANSNFTGKNLISKIVRNNRAYTIRLRLLISLTNILHMWVQT